MKYLIFSGLVMGAIGYLAYSQSDLSDEWRLIKTKDIENLTKELSDVQVKNGILTQKLAEITEEFTAAKLNIESLVDDSKRDLVLSEEKTSVSEETPEFGPQVTRSTNNYRQVGINPASHDKIMPNRNEKLDNLIRRMELKAAGF